MRENNVEETILTKRDHGWLDRLVTIVAAIACIYNLGYLLRVFMRFDIVYLPSQHAALFAAFTLSLIFLTSKEEVKRLHWGYLLAAGAAFLIYLYAALSALEIMDRGGKLRIIDFAVGIVGILTIFELVRRVHGWSMVILVFLLFLYSAYGNYVPGIMKTQGLSWHDIVSYTFYGGEGAFGQLFIIFATLVFLFMLFGQLIVRAGAGKFVIDVSNAIAGRFRGGPAKVAVLASATFGMLSGSGSANVATTGVFTIPMMKKIGYKPSFAGAVEGAASHCGAFTPPIMGGTAFLMAQFMEVPYGLICISAAIPAFLYILGVLVQVDLEAKKDDLKGLPRSELPSLRKTLSSGWPFSIPVATLVLLLMVWQYPAQMACFYSLGALLVVSYFRKETRLTPRVILECFRGTILSIRDILPLIAIAGLFVGAFHLSGLGISISQIIISISGGNIVILLVLAAVLSYLLGLGLPGSACFIIVALLVAPTLIMMGVPKFPAYFFVYFCAMWSGLTPPVAQAPWIAAAIAGGPPQRTAWLSCRLAIAQYILPFLLVMHPALLILGATPKEIVSVLIPAVLAIIAISTVGSGYLFCRLRILQSLLLIAAAVLLIANTMALNLAGAGVLTATIAWQWRDYASKRSEVRGQ